MGHTSGLGFKRTFIRLSWFHGETEQSLNLVKPQIQYQLHG